MTSLALFVFSANSHFFISRAYAANNSNEDDVNILATDDIKKNPIAMKILKNIEISKMRIADMLKKQALAEQQKNILEKQRKEANDDLQRSLQRMENENLAYAPRESFTKFVSQVDGTTQNVFWGQFEFMEQKVNDARDAKKRILENGGTMDEARKEYHKMASIMRHEIINHNKELNIKYGHADDLTQKYFDKHGKLPRSNE